jgi:hypothetical protein
MSPRIHSVGHITLDTAAALYPLKKIPQPSEFNNMLRGQNRTHKLSLGSGVDLVQVMLGRGLGHELPNELIQCAVSNK